MLRGLGPIVEIGAGSGYWTAMLRAAGHAAIATDIVSEGVNIHGSAASLHVPIEALAGHAAVRRYPERDVLCSWPTEGSPWALAAVRAMRPGRRLAPIGDGRGGCTGAPGLYRFLETRFEAGPVVILPQFPGVSDRLSLYRRIR